MGALGKGATLRRDGAPRDRVGGQGHPRQAPVCAGLQEGAEGERDRRPGYSQGGERKPSREPGTAAQRTGPGGKEHGAVGCGLLRRPGGNSAGGRDAGERQVLPGEKGKAPAGEDRQGAALPVPQVHRSKREV